MNPSSPLRVATCQFPVEADIDHNLGQMLRLLDEAARREARVAHFCEAAASGYFGVDVPDPSTVDWDQLHRAIGRLKQAAAQRRMWLVVGSAHRLSGGRKPHNCMYVIDDQGRIVERYDKRFCTGVLEPAPTMDLQHYTPGNHRCTFDIDGWRCGVLICYDYRFPELYRDLKRAGVQVVFHGFHNARRTRQEHEQGNVWRDIVPATLMCHAACNHVWISAANSAAQYSSWPSFFVRPDGRIVGQLADHQTGVLISDISPAADLWDAPGPWRDRALSGILHSGELADDPRSADRTCY